MQDIPPHRVPLDFPGDGELFPAFPFNVYDDGSVAAGLGQCPQHRPLIALQCL